MTAVSLCFEVHQPLRLKKNFFWDGMPLREVVPDLEEFYFDDAENRRIFERVSDKCYLPANEVILECIKSMKPLRGHSLQPTASQAYSWSSAGASAQRFSTHSCGWRILAVWR